MNTHFKSSILTITLLLSTACIPEIAPPQPPPAPTDMPTWPATTSPLHTDAPTPSPSVTESPTDTPSLTPSSTVPSTPTPTPIPTPTPTVDPDLDFDGDGFTTVDGDCQPRDPEIYPGAFDMPFDGQDGNCNGVQDQITHILGATLNEGGDARYARMDEILDIEMATDGTLYVSDDQLCNIRRIKDGIITTLIGNGFCESTGDGKHMSMAGVSRARSLAIDERRDRLYYITVGEIWYLDLKTEIVHHFAGNRDNYGVIKAKEGIAPDEVYFEDDTLTIDDRWGTLYFTSNYALFQLETDPQYYDRLQVVMGSPGTPGKPTEGTAYDSLMMNGFSIQLIKETETIYLALSSQESDFHHAIVASLRNGELEFLAGQQDDCFWDYKDSTGDYDHPNTLEEIDEGTPEQMMFCVLRDMSCIDSECFIADYYHLYHLDIEQSLIKRLNSSISYNPPGHIEGELRAFEEGDIQSIAVDPIRNLTYDHTQHALLWSEPYNQIIRKMEIESQQVVRVGGYGGAGFYSDGIHPPLLGQVKDILPVLDTASESVMLYASDLLYDTVSRIQENSIHLEAGIPGLRILNGGDGIASERPLYGPAHLQRDTTGTIFLYSYDHQIKKIEEGKLSTIAGVEHGETGLDFGPALDVELESPQTMQYDPKSHQLFILQAKDSSSLITLSLTSDIPPEIHPFLAMPTNIDFDGFSVDLSSVADFVKVDSDIYFINSYPAALVKYDGHIYEPLVISQDISATLPTTRHNDAILSTLTRSKDGTLYFYDEWNAVLYQYHEPDQSLFLFERISRIYHESPYDSISNIPVGHPTIGPNGELYLNNSELNAIYQIDW